MTTINSITAYNNSTSSQEVIVNEEQSSFVLQDSSESLSYNNFIFSEEEQEVVNINSSILSVYDTKNEFIQNNFINLLENKSFLKVVSFNQREIKEDLNLHLTGEQNSFLNLYKNHFNDLETIKSKFYSFEPVENFLLESKNSIENYFKFIRELDYIFAYSKEKDKEVNYANKFIDFIRDKQSSDFGKILKIGFTDSIKENTDNHENFRIMSSQNYEEVISHDFINEIFAKRYLRIENINLELSDISSSFIYNSDKLFTQNILDTFKSFYAINSDLIFIDSYGETQENLIFKNEDYPVIQIGNNIFKNNIIEYINNFSFLKDRFIKDNKLSLDIEYNTQSRHHHSKNKFSVYNATNTEIRSSFNLLNKRFNPNLQRDPNDPLYFINENKNDCVFIDECSIFHGNIVFDDINLETEDVDTTNSLLNTVSGIPGSKLPLSFFNSLKNSGGGAISFLNFDPSRNITESAEVNSRLSLSDGLFSNLADESQIERQINELNIPSHRAFFNRPEIDTLLKLNNEANEKDNDVLNLSNFLNWSSEEIEEYCNYNFSFVVDLYNNSYESVTPGIVLQIITMIIKLNKSLEEQKEYYQTNDENNEYNYSRLYSSNNVIGYKEKIQEILNEFNYLVKNVVELFKQQYDLIVRLKAVENSNELFIQILRFLDVDHKNNIQIFFDKLTSLKSSLFQDFKFIFLLRDYNRNNTRSAIEQKLQFTNPARVNEDHPRETNDNPFLEFIEKIERREFRGSIETGRRVTYKYKETSRIINTTKHNFYLEGNEESIIAWPIVVFNRAGGGGERIESYNNEFPSSLTSFDQYFWKYNNTKDSTKLYPRVYDYLLNLIKDFNFNRNYNIQDSDRNILASDIDPLDYQNYGYDNWNSTKAGIYKDSTNKFNSRIIIDSNNTFINNLHSDDEQNYIEIRSIFDLHAYTLDGSINKKINNIRHNFIEPVSSNLNFLDIKVNLLNCLNEVRKHKTSQNGVELKNIIDFGKKVYERSLSLSKEQNDISFTYGNEDNENILLLESDEELKHLIEDDIMTNNFKKELFFNRKKIRTASFRINNNIKPSINYKKHSSDVKKMLSLIYSNSIFKDTRSFYKRILKDIKEYSEDISSPVIDKDDTNNDLLNYASSYNAAYTRGYLRRSSKNKELKERLVYNNYDSFISEIFSNDCSYDESIEYIKRIVSFTICKNTNFSNIVENISEVKFKEEKEVYEENIQDIVNINKINENSKKVFDFIYSKKNIDKLLNYVVLQYSNGDTLDNSDYSSSLNIWTYKREVQKKISSFNSVYDHSNSHNHNYNSFIEILNSNDNYSNLYTKIDNRRELGGNNYKLNISNEYNIIKKINVKDYEEKNRDLDENDKEIDLTYKFYCDIKEKLWLVKSRLKNDNDKIGKFEGITNPFEKNEEGGLLHSDFPFSEIASLFPSFDIFYYNANNEKSMIHKFYKLVESLLKYNNLDFEQFKKYEDVKNYIEDNTNLVKVIYEIFKLYSKFFQVLFKRQKTFKLYSLIEMLSSNYVFQDDDKESNINKRNYADLRSVVKTFYKSKELIADVDAIYNIINDSSYTQDQLLKIKNIFDNIKESNNIFNSKDTEIMLDLFVTAIHNDAINSLRFDSILGFYENFEKIEKRIDDSLEEMTQSELFLENFNLNDESIKSYSNNEFFKNIVSKKLQNSYFIKYNTYNDLINLRANSRDKKHLEHFKYNKKLRLNSIKLLSRFYEKINNATISGTFSNNNYLNNKHFDFIKIGIDSKQVYNLQPNSILKFSIFTINHETIGNSYLSDGTVGTTNVKSFLYSPFLTSIPASYFDIVNRDQSQKYIGFYDVNKEVSRRFRLVTVDEVSNYVNIYLKTSYDDIVSEYPDLDDFISGNNLSKKLFTDMYFSQFAEYYDMLINNFNSLDISENFENLQNMILNRTFDTFNNIEDNKFKNIFSSEKSLVLDLSQINNTFTILKTRQEEIELNNKTNSFINNYSKISSDMDMYKNLLESKYYDFFNIMIESPVNTNYSYAIKVELL